MLTPTPQQFIKTVPTKTIRLDWTQKGHSTIDPCGIRSFDMSATWTVCAEENIEEWCQKARDYAESQTHWTGHKITVT